MIEQLRAGLGRARRPAVLGVWDEPTGPEIVIHDPLVRVSGWAFARQGGSPSVTVLLDGRPAASPVADAARPDVAAVHGPAAQDCGWSAVIGPVADGSVITVQLEHDRRVLPLGRRVVSLREAPPVPPIGNLDSPSPGEVVSGPAVSVRGWVILDGAPAERVELFLGDRAAVLARRCDVRPDLDGHPVGVSATRLAAGFSELISTEGLGGEISVSVRATGVAGSLWHGGPRKFRVSPPPPPPEPLAPSPLTGAVSGGGATGVVPDGRIGVLTHSLQLGGGELWLFELLVRLAAAGRDLVAISPMDGPLRDELVDAGVAVHITAGYTVDPKLYQARVAELSASLNALGVSAVLANTAGVFPAVDAARLSGLPVVWAIHESFELGVFAKLNWGDSLHPAVRARWRETLRDADVLVFEAEATRAMYAGMVPGARTKVVRYGIDLDAIERYQREHDRDALRAALGLEPDDRVVLCMGVFQERKAQLAVVHAFAQLAQAHPRAHLVLVGSHPSPYSDAVRRCVDDLGLAGAVRIVDIDPDTYRWYHVADVLLSASDVESLPRSILEAMAFGVPPLAASVFGIPEVVEDGVSGWLFRTRDGAALVAALRRVLGASEDELRTAQSAARRAAQRFDGQGYADEIGELLDRLQVASRDLSGISAGG